jgi:hypothetical protein
VELTAPASLSGRWTFNAQISDTWSVQVQRIHDDGRLEGLLTYAGRRCRARDTPIKEGSWRDGVPLLRASGGPDCGDLHFELKPGSQRLLEGTASADFDRNQRTPVWLDRR